MENETCRWKHLGGAMIASCHPKWITDYHYYEPEKMKALLPIFRIIKSFKYCPYCSKPIELPKWMVEAKEGEI